MDVAPPQAPDDLFNGNQRLAHWCLRRCIDVDALQAHDQDDLAQVALLALWVACKRFDAARGKLATLAMVAVRHRVSREVQRPSRRAFTGLDAEHAAPEPPGDPLPPEVRLALERLPCREQLILSLRFGLDGGDGMTLREVGDKFGLSRERIRQIEADALGRLRRAAGVTV